MAVFFVYKSKVGKWDSSDYKGYNVLLNNVKQFHFAIEEMDLEFVTSFEQKNPNMSREKSLDTLHAIIVNITKDVTRSIILGKEQLPPLEQLSTTSRNICVVVKSWGQNLYLSVPIHYYYAWKQLEDNNMEEDLKQIISLFNKGCLFVRLPTLEELDTHKFLHHQSPSVKEIFMLASYHERINEVLKGTIYESGRLRHL